MDKQLLQKLLDQGTILITSSLSSEDTSGIILTLLDRAQDPSKEIELYISSCSDDYVNVMAIYDVLMSLKNPLSGYAIGAVSNCALLLLACCNKGKRYILPNTILSVHELSDAVGAGPNQQTEFEILARDIAYKEDTFETLLAKHSNLSKEEIHKLCLEETDLNAKEAVKAGFVDIILEGK